MTKSFLMDHSQKLLREYESMVIAFSEAIGEVVDGRRELTIPEAKVDFLTKAVYAAAELQLYYGRLTTNYSNMLDAINGQLDACEYMQDEQQYEAISQRVKPIADRLELAKHFYAIAEAQAEKWISQLDEAQLALEQSEKVAYRMALA